MFLNSSLKKKITLTIVSLVFIFLGLFIFLYSSVIFQEGNPWPQIKGVIKLSLTDKEIIPVSANKYITKSDDGAEVINRYLENKGYNFIEQMGSGYLYQSADQLISVVRRQYSRFYLIWNIGESNSLNNLVESRDHNTIAEELQECLPKSDMASYEKCNELLAEIRNFADCVSAGFNIMKSNPPQCTVPDGRIFTDDTNSSWDIVLTALNDCQVESVFQAHSRFVSVDLKNGNKITAYEPQIDDIMKAVDGLEGRCGKIRMATE